MNAPTVAMVWAPSMDSEDSKYPYAPYWPGPEYVDWVAMSIYWKGSTANYPMSYLENMLCPTDFTAQIMDAVRPKTGPMEGGPVSFYQQYAVKFNKPMAISEGGAAFQIQYSSLATGAVTPIAPGPGRTAVIMSFWNSNIFNPNFLRHYPKLKMVFSFEICKVENEAGIYSTTRDYRIVADADTIAAFRDGMKVLDAAGSIQWANKVLTSAPSSTANTLLPTFGGVAVVTAAPTTALSASVTQPTSGSSNQAQMDGTQPKKNPSEKNTYSLFSVASAFVSTVFFI
ncbi:hypothetical protein HDU98_007843 [Podochytrium sp. JEL0797]|nr:hypothetical protein HDU98_007843 [Podochytrium sp. JEL0797]